MNENAKKWVAALRSGEYEQGEKRLHNLNGSMCCLGIGCEVYRIETGNGEWRRNHREKCCEFVLGGAPIGATSGLPDEVKQWLGLRENMGTYGVFTDKYHALFKDNDGLKTFPEIADIIESEPPGLFVEEKH